LVQTLFLLCASKGFYVVVKAVALFRNAELVS